MANPSEFDTGAFELRDLTEEAQPRTDAAGLTADVAALSHPGLKRANNEDHYLVTRLRRSLDVLATNLPERYAPARFEEAGFALAVADGMGGAEAGEVASALALSVGTALTISEPTWHLRLDEVEADRLVARVRQYFQRIHRAVADRAHSMPALSGMGTTLTTAYSVGQDLFVFHVGDSRAYLWRAGHLEQITRDQTVAQALADAGQISPEEVHSHRLRHVLTHAIGSDDPELSATIARARLTDGDRLLVCTDGLTDMVDDAGISEALGAAPAPDAACRTLVDLALSRGGHDNVTAVVAFYRAWR
jgi:protein phosphatase